jgi:hypothetical protein
MAALAVEVLSVGSLGGRESGSPIGRTLVAGVVGAGGGRLVFV